MWYALAFPLAFLGGLIAGGTIVYLYYNTIDKKVEAVTARVDKIEGSFKS